MPDTSNMSYEECKKAWIAALKEEHPDWSAEQVIAEARKKCESKKPASEEGSTNA